MSSPANNIITLPQARLMQEQDKAPASLATKGKLLGAQGRFRFVSVALEQMANVGWSLNRAAEHVYHLSLSPSSSLHAASLEFGKGGKPVSKAQIARWVDAYQRHGMDALTDKREGRARKEYGWELRAMQLYARPQKPSVQLVVDQLHREGFDDAEYSRVHRYIKSLPTDLTTHSSGRLGAKEVKLNHRSYRHRTTENLPVGHTYQLDGHTIDTRLAHRQTGKLWRPELTLVIDVASRYIPGWWMGDAENATNTLFALADSFVRHDHIPAALHLDNGSGFKGKLMNTESTGYYDRFGLSVMFSLPGNAKGKGQVERWFRTMEESFGKQWDTYCGKDMSASAERNLIQKVKQGKYPLPSLQQYMDGLREWIDEYHHKPHRGLHGRTPADMWAELERVPLECPTAAVVLPRESRKIVRGYITLHGRTYGNPELFHFDGKHVLVEYSVHNDQMIRVLSENEVWLCDANLVSKVDYKPTSRIEEETQKRLKHQIKRKELHIEEDKRRAGMTLGHEAATQGILELESQKKGGAIAPPQYPLDQDEPEIVIDLTNWTPTPRD